MSQKTKRAYIRLCPEKLRKEEFVHQWVKYKCFIVTCDYKDCKQPPITQSTMQNKFN